MQKTLRTEPWTFDHFCQLATGIFTVLALLGAAVGPNDVSFMGLPGRMVFAMACMGAALLFSSITLVRFFARQRELFRIWEQYNRYPG